MIVRNVADTIEPLFEDVRGAFDEYIFVAAGKSSDATEEKIRAAFGVPFPEVGRAIVETPYGKVILSRFRWVDDFAAARNFSYSLASAEWRAYLDGDDRWPEAKKLRQAVEIIEKKAPETGCLKIPYECGDARSHVARVVRWKDGWTWHLPVHEHLVASVPVATVAVPDLPVSHAPPPGHLEGSALRNEQIMRNTIADPKTPKSDADMLKYYLASHYWAQGDYPAAAKFFEDCAESPDSGALGVEAAAQRGFLALTVGDEIRAVKWAERATSRDESRTGYLVLGVALTRAGHFKEAVAMFELAFSLPESALVYKVQVGLALIYAAIANLAVNGPKSGDDLIEQIPPEVRKDERIVKLAKIYSARRVKYPLGL